MAEPTEEPENASILLDEIVVRANDAKRRLGDAVLNYIKYYGFISRDSQNYNPNWNNYFRVEQDWNRFVDLYLKVVEFYNKTESIRLDWLAEFASLVNEMRTLLDENKGKDKHRIVLKNYLTFKQFYSDILDRMSLLFAVGLINDFFVCLHSLAYIQPYYITDERFKVASELIINVYIYGKYMFDDITSSNFIVNIKYIKSLDGRVKDVLRDEFFKEFLEKFKDNAGTLIGEAEKGENNDLVDVLRSIQSFVERVSYIREKKIINDIFVEQLNSIQLGRSSNESKQQADEENDFPKSNNNGNTKLVDGQNEGNTESSVVDLGGSEDQAQADGQNSDNNSNEASRKSTEDSRINIDDFVDKVKEGVGEYKNNNTTSPLDNTMGNGGSGGKEDYEPYDIIFYMVLSDVEFAPFEMLISCIGKKMRLLSIGELLVEKRLKKKIGVGDEKRREVLSAQPNLFYECEIDNFDFINGDATRYREACRELLIDGKKISVLFVVSNRMGMVFNSILMANICILFDFKLFFHVGICAGIDNASNNIGDVVIPTLLFDYNSGKKKAIKDKHGRPIDSFEPYWYPELMNARDEAFFENLLSRKKNVFNFCSSYLKFDVHSIVDKHMELYDMNSSFPHAEFLKILKSSRAVLAPMASGSSVIASSAETSEIQKLRGKLKAFDMESYALDYTFKYFMSENQHVDEIPNSVESKMFIMKAVSDFGDDSKSEDKEMKQLTAGYSAAMFSFTFSLLMLLEMKIKEKKGTKGDVNPAADFNFSDIIEFKKSKKPLITNKPL